MRKSTQKLYQLSFLVLTLIIWSLISFTVEMNNLWFAKIDTVFFSFIDIFKSNYYDIVATFILIVKSSIITIVSGTILGFLIGFNTRLYVSSNWFLDFWRSIPPIVMLYILVNFQDEQGDEWRVWLVIFGALPIIILQIADAIRSISSKRFEAIESAKPSKYFLFKNIVFFEVLPLFFSTVRTIISFSIIIIIVSEMIIGPEYGIGESITSYQSNYKIAYVYAYAILLGTIGMMLNYFLRILENKFVNW